MGNDVALFQKKGFSNYLANPRLSSSNNPAAFQDCFQRTPEFYCHGTILIFQSHQSGYDDDMTNSSTSYVTTPRDIYTCHTDF